VSPRTLQTALVRQRLRALCRQEALA
jgi:hypothetical protein